MVEPLHVVHSVSKLIKSWKGGVELGESILEVGGNLNVVEPRERGDGKLGHFKLYVDEPGNAVDSINGSGDCIISGLDVSLNG